MGAGKQDCTVDCIEAIHGRRSIRSFDPRDVPRDLISAILDDAAAAPPPFSAAHKPMPWEFYVFEGAARNRIFGGRAKQYSKDRKIGIAERLEQDDYKLFWDAPVVVVIAGSFQDCARAAMVMTLSAHARGLGSCWVGSPLAWLRDEAVRSELGLKEDIAAAVCIGYAKSPADPREPTPPIVHWL
ncbi:MAG: nitroreductase family protein [Devosia sp.]|jgi:nitroreductase|nr:nitroreductase family protein [Devosia sp.]